MNIIDSFSKQLHSLVYSAAQINTEEYRINGYEKSKENKGNLDIFRTEYNTIKERIRTYATDQGLGNIKNVLSSNISIAYESTKSNLENEKLDSINASKRENDIENKQLINKIEGKKLEKSVFESGNTATGEKGLFQINKDIERIRLERNGLDQSFIIKKFWNAGTILVLGGIAIFAFYLSIFFASAVYKVFFEGNAIRAALEAGINPGLPQLVDANAISKIFRMQGPLFGFIAALFFLIPILLSNLKILGSENKLVNNVLFWAGLVVFDILVSTMVAVNTDEIKSLLVGKESTMQLWEVIKHGEFWLIFVFGMFPLLLMHFLIDNIYKAFRNSKREIVDAEKNRNIQLLDLEMINLVADKENFSNLVKIKDEEILDLKNNINKLEKEVNLLQTQIEAKYAEMQKQIKAIYDDFSAKIISGQLFTEVILNSVIAAYKSGFIEFLPEFYASNEVALRVIQIDQVSNI